MGKSKITWFIKDCILSNENSHNSNELFNQKLKHISQGGNDYDQTSKQRTDITT